MRCSTEIRDRSGELKLYIVAYDIPDDRRRNKMHKKLRDFGFAVQYSVFECFLHPKQRKLLQSSVEKIADKEEDIVAIWGLGDCCADRCTILGKGDFVDPVEIDII